MERRSSVNFPWDEEDEFIDMDVSSATFFSCSFPASPPPISEDFEFQMFTDYRNSEKQPSTTSPADELFYKGKLLPLYLPPRLHMVQKLLERDDKFNDSFTTAAATITPFESCQVSPSPSCYVSGELDPRHYFSDYLRGDISNSSSSNSSINIKKCSWAKKLKLMKKLKASKEYIKSLFSISRTNCLDDNGFPSIDNKTGSKKEEEGCGHRRSFSGAIRRPTKTKYMASLSSSSSSVMSSKSSSFSSASSSGKIMLKRSTSVGSDAESSIRGAIAHCKKSQGKTMEVAEARKSVSNVELYSISDICRG